MVQLKNISEHRPKDMVIDIAENDVKTILKTGEFQESIKENLIVQNNPDINRTEKEIKKQLDTNVPEVAYNISDDTKKRH